MREMRRGRFLLVCLTTFLMLQAGAARGQSDDAEWETTTEERLPDPQDVIGGIEHTSKIPEWLGFAVAGLLALFCASAVFYLCYIWIRQRRYTKERFAFAALNSIVLLTTTCIVALSGRVAPWNLVAALVDVAFGAEFDTSSATFADSTLLLIAYGFAVYYIHKMFSGWHGLRSQRQYRMEQRRESMVLIVEGFREARRMLRREPALSVYDFRVSGPQVQFKYGDFVAWRERARNLVRLKWPHYVFEDSDWDEGEKCWVGRNTRTNALVLLQCVFDGLDEFNVQSAIARVEDIRSARGEADAEAVVAVEGYHADTSPRWGGSGGVQLETEGTLLDSIVDLTDYRRDIRNRMTIARLPDSKLTISDVFVEPSFTPSGWTLTDSANLEEHLAAWLDEPGHRQLSLLGDYGQGKSTAAVAITYRMLFVRTDSLRIPILIELRGTSPRNLRPLQLLGAWCAKYNINPQALLYLHQAGRLLLIFEGFDEMALVGDREMRLRHFKTLWEFWHPGAKILITGRPNFFLDEREMMVALGIGEPIGGQPYCRAMRLHMFGLPQIRSALRSYDKKLQDEVYGFAAEDHQFRELIARPSLLHIVAVLWRRENLSEHLDKLTSAYVMNLFVRHSYRRQGLKEQESPEFMALTTEERHYFMKGIATYMASRRLPNQIDGAGLNEAIGSLVEAAPDAVSLSTQTIGGEEREPLKKRVADYEYGMEHVQTDVRTCGLLVDDPAGLGTFRFGHKSFMEYMFAEVISDLIVRRDDPASPSILNACNASAADLARLPVSISFLSEILVANMSELNQRDIGIRVLQLMFGSPWTYALGRVQLFDIAVRKLRASAPRQYRAIVPASFGGTRVVTALVVLAVALALVLSVGIVGMFRQSDPSLPMFFLGLRVFLEETVIPVVLPIVVFGWIAVARATRGLWRQIESRLRVWGRVCQELGIADRVLFGISGAAWLPWSRGRSFDVVFEGGAASDGRATQGSGS